MGAECFRRMLAACGLSLWLMAPLAAALPSQQTSSPEQDAKALFAEGLQRQHEHRYAEAITAYRRSLKIDPDQPEALNNAGFCYKQMKDYKNAVRYYKDALRLNPKLAEAHEYLGEAYVQMGRLELAEQEYQKLLTLDPEEAEELKDKIDGAKAPAR